MLGGQRSVNQVLSALRMSSAATSHTTGNVVNFPQTVSCEEREEVCEEGLFCEEVVFNGNMAGSFHASSAACDEVVCGDTGEECVMEFIDTNPENAFATCKSLQDFENSNCNTPQGRLRPKAY